MSKTVGIIGVGQVGAAAAYMLSVTPGVDNIVLVDPNTERATAEATDIGHSAAFNNSVKVYEGNYQDLTNADVIVITAGFSLKPGQTRLELLNKNLKLTDSIIESALKASPNAVLLFATNPVDVMPAVAVNRYQIPAGRAIATGCALDSIRFKHSLSQQFGISPTSIDGFVFGEHGDSSVTGWSSTSIGGIPVVDFAAQIGQKIDDEMKAKIADNVRTSAYKIKSGKGVSNYGIGGCIARLVSAVVNNERSVFSVSTFLSELFGVKNTCVSLPHVIGKAGASAPFIPALNDQEKQDLIKSAEILSTTIANGLASL